MARLVATVMVLLVAGCSALPPGHSQSRQESHALPPAAGTLGVGASEENAHVGQSAFRMIAAGLDGLAMRIESIDSAQRSLDLQYYIFRADESGLLVAQALLRAADRGVRVRILVDDGESIAGDERLFALAAHPLIQIRVFNPFDYRGHVRVLRALDFAMNKNRLDYRMHNKLMLVDNSLGIIGGRNIGDQYFQIDPRSQFGDDDVTVMGPMVRRLSGVFDEFWNAPLSIPIDAIDKKHSSNALHAKLYVFDRRSVFVGSMNFDQRSERINTEIGLIIDSQTIAVAAESRFEALTQLTEAYSVQLANSSDRQKEHLVWKTEEHGVVTARFKEPGRSTWQSFKARMLAWLPLDGEL